MESKFSSELLKANLFYLRSFLNAKYENQLDIFINYNGQICKKVYSTYSTELLSESEIEDFGIKSFFANLLNEDLPAHNSMNLSYSMSKILCENHSRRISSSIKASILIVNENVSVPNSQYVQLMNSVFEAQRNGIKINVLDLNHPASAGNVLLKQAASITSGYYLNISSVSEVIPALFTFSPEISSSSQNILNTFKQESVDFRGSCFCHGKVVDIGYVCSVCLSGNIIFNFYNCFKLVIFSYNSKYFVHLILFAKFARLNLVFPKLTNKIFLENSYWTSNCH